ncbi:hypothetical protein RJ641_005822 [Dillenia turbinata]|uniref:Uncharacterized protein n=1 Tax=Dillenia turbinata TaxID=194707 RepID=A0AAN8VBW3_9MAGN
METMFSKARLLLGALASFAICWVFVKTVYGLRLKPRTLEKGLRKQGILGCFDHETPVSAADKVIIEIDDIVVEINTGYMLTLQDLRHILDIRINLLSINVLDNESYESQ